MAVNVINPVIECHCPLYMSHFLSNSMSLLEAVYLLQLDLTYCTVLLYLVEKMDNLSLILIGGGNVGSLQSFAR